jgi:hypothetical protein
MPAKTVHLQSKIDFIKEIMRQKVRETRMYDTPACQHLANQVNLSYATLLKALKGEFTLRTVRRMEQAGWFLHSEYIRGQKQTDTSWRTPPGHRRKQRQNNDKAQQKSREDAAFRRGYRQGKAEGYNQGRQSRTVGNAGSAQAYSRGYTEGLRDGEARARRNGSSSSGNAGVPMSRLQSLLNMTTNNGASQGEVVAARKAVGKTLAKWLKEKFNQDLNVQVS